MKFTFSGCDTPYIQDRFRDCGESTSTAVSLSGAVTDAYVKKGPTGTVTGFALKTGANSAFFGSVSNEPSEWTQVTGLKLTGY